MKTQIQAPSGSFQNRPKSFLRKRVTISNTWVPQDIHGSEEGHLLPLWNLRHGWIWDGLLFVVPSKNMTQLDPVATPPVPHTKAVLTTKKGFFFPSSALTGPYNMALPSESNWFLLWRYHIFFQTPMPFRTSGDWRANAKNLWPSLNLASSPYSATGRAPWPGWSAIHCATSLQWCQYFLAEGTRCISSNSLVVIFPQKGPHNVLVKPPQNFAK